MSLLRLFRKQEGFALIMAIGVLGVLTIAGTTAMIYTASNTRNAGRSASDGDAYSLAEAGMGYALSVLENASDPRVATLLPGTTVSLGSGTATYSGTITGYVWTLTSVGQIPNPRGAPIKRTIHRTVTVQGINSGANGTSWSRFYQDSAASCLTIDTETFVTNVGTRGDLCLVNNGAITGANTVVDVGGNVTIVGPDTTTTRSAGTGAGWTNSTNVTSSNNAYATTSIAGLATSPVLDSSSFGMGVPSSAYIRGISARIERSSSVASTIKDANVYLLKSGAPAGTDKASNSNWPTSDAYQTYGTGSDLWGTTWTAADVNASNFGLRLLATNAGAPTSSSSIKNAGTGTGASWTTPGNVVSSNNTYATQSLGAGVTSGTLDATNFAFALPAGAVVTGVSTRIEKKASVSSTIKDLTVQLLKAGSPVGNNKASASFWTTADAYTTYGAAGDLWGTTLTQADVNASNFGFRLVAKNFGGSTSIASIDHMELTVYYDTYSTSTASVDHMEITATHSSDTNGIGASGANIQQANITGTCKYNANAAHTPCTSADHVYAGTITTPAAGTNPALSMPAVDFNYWWANAKPGPKHFCTNASPGLATDFFDNNAGSTSVSDHSLPGNGEMTPDTTDYTCQVVENGVLKGEMSWNHTTHVMTIFGTVFIDGNFRFDDDGEVIHYQGRATLMSGGHDEIDEVVCAGGSGTTVNPSCLTTGMQNWDPTQNYMVLMSKEDNEYDQGGTSCSGDTHPTCYNGHTPAGFQGVLYSTADCLIHQNFQDSGPVICNTITLPNESGINPTFYTFPYAGNLTDGQKYADTATATSFELTVGMQDG